MRLEARLKEAESRLTEHDEREECEKWLLNRLEGAKGVLSIQGRKLEESDAEKADCVILSSTQISTTSICRPRAM